MADGALKLYGKLNAEQKKLVQEKKIETSMKAKKWLEFLRQIAFFDRLRDQAHRKLKTGAIIVGIIDLIMLGGVFSYSIVAAVLFVLLLIFFIFLIIRFKKIKNIDISNNLRLFVVPLLVALKEEIDPNTKVFIKMDLTDALHSTKLKDTILPQGKRYPKITTFMYNNPWFEVRAQLNDKTILQWDIEDIIRHRKIRKISASGKLKFKEKFKVKHIISMKLLFSKDLYTIKSRENIEYADQGEYHMIKLKNKAYGYSKNSIMELNAFLGTVAMAYRNFEQI